LTDRQVKARERGVRAGGYALSLLSTPLNVGLLRALAEGPKPLPELRRELGFPPQTTLRKHLKELSQIDAIAKRRSKGPPSHPDYELATPGHELLALADVLQDWLSGSPCGPLPLGSRAAKAATKALGEGWSTTLLRVLAARPFSLTELNRLLSNLTYPALESRLSAMRRVGLLNSLRGQGRPTPYRVTRWLRLAVGPLVAAVHWERRHLPEETAPLGRIDAEAVFLLAAPLLTLPRELSGHCRLAMEVPKAGGRRMTGVMVGVEEGRIASCTARLEGDAAAWASGSVPAWLRAVTAQETDQIELGGDCQLARALLDGLHEALFGGTRPVSGTADLLT
jgi:DNA-binding HxlR family transcriptional regulator